MTITLGWPPKVLNPNARVHWSKKAKAVKAYRDAAYWETRAAAPHVPASPHLTITFVPPDHRHRDLDNMLASIKSGLDGIAQAIGVDDSKFTLTIAIDHSQVRGWVLVEIN